jgi:polyferredoxin
MEFWSVLLTFVSMVDYTEREERLREKEKCFPSPAHHRERRNFFLIIIIIIFRRGVFTNLNKITV